MKALKILILFVLSCSTEPEYIYGCTVETAINYNHAAVENGNTCEHNGVVNGCCIYEVIGDSEDAGNPCIDLPQILFFDTEYDDNLVEGGVSCWIPLHRLISSG